MGTGSAPDAGAPWRFLHEPLTPIKDELAAALLRLCKATCQVMGEFATPEDLTILDTAIQEVHQARYHPTPTRPPPPPQEIY